MMKSQIKKIIGKNKISGITLISLIITIIVLLILAGITLAGLSEENGLFGKVQSAKDKWHEAQEQENLYLAEYENYIKDYSEGYGEGESAKKGKWELLASTESKIETECKVKDLKQFSSFMLICYSDVDTGNLVATTHVNYNLLIGNYDVFANYNDGASYVARCRYVDDTTIKLQCCNYKTLKAELYGIY